jgi:hypothetical protein
LSVVFSCKPIEPDTQRVVIKDNAMLCMGVGIAGSAGRAELRAGQTLPVIVRSLGCLSNECATKRQAQCAVKRDGNKLVVTSELSWTAPGALERPCPGTCSMLDATCSIEPLQPGKYTVVHGARTMEVQVPSEIVSGCVEGKPPAAAAIAAMQVDSGVDASTPVIASIPSAVASAAAVTAAPPSTGAPTTPEPPPETICVSSILPKTGGKPPKASPLAITITHPNKCVGSSCSAGTPKCTAKRKGKAIVVNATFPAPGAKPRAPCTDDCRALAASCKTEPIPNGVYSVQVGTHSEEFNLPAQSVCKP